MGESYRKDVDYLRDAFFSSVPQKDCGVGVVPRHPEAVNSKDSAEPWGALV